MYVACSNLCFARYPLDRALRIMAELEFSKLDMAIHEQGPHLRPSEVAADVTLAAQKIRIGPSLSPAAFDVEIEATGQEFHEQLQAICRLAKLSAVSLLMLPAAPSASGVDAEVDRLRQLVGIVEAHGLILTVPTRQGTITETPEGALELCQRVPGLGLTLDPSHYVNGPYQADAFDVLFPYVRHVHLRDTGKGPGKLQVRVGQGEIEYGRIISLLDRHKYDRVLTVAIHDIPDAPFVMETEVRKLKYLLESLV